MDIGTNVFLRKVWCVMEKLKKYCSENGYEFDPNCGCGITIYVPFDDAERVIKYIERTPGVVYSPSESGNNYNLGLKILAVFEVE